MSRCRSKKIRYRTELDAKIALSNIQYKLAVRGACREVKTEARVYRCPMCGGWHLTSKLKNGEAA